MRVLLINPPSEHTSPEFGDPENLSAKGMLDTVDFGLFPPLGLLYVLSSFRSKAPEHEAFFLDCVAERIGHAELAGRVSGIAPDIVGITSFSYALYDVCLCARTIRALLPGVHICMGGHHPIAFPLEAAGLPEFDSIIVGEGEEAFPALVLALSSGGDITRIPGVYTRTSIRHHVDAVSEDRRFLTSVMVPAAYIDNLDLLPTPDRKAISHINYRSVVGVSPRLTTMISSRGCPFSCTFCDVPYKCYRQRSLGPVADEVRECLDLGYDEIHFYDDLFNITPERVIAFCDEVERRGYQFVWDFRGRVNSVTYESLRRAKQAGCRMISFGVETGSDEGLRLLNKGTTTEQVRRVFEWCRELGILSIADFMIGLPFEKSAADVRCNVDFLLKLDPDYAQFSVLSLYPNTELYGQAVNNGVINPERWLDFVSVPYPGFQMDHWEEFLPASELLMLQRESYRRYYLRPRYIWRSLIHTCSWHEFTSKLGGLAKLLRR